MKLLASTIVGVLLATLGAALGGPTSGAGADVAGTATTARPDPRTPGHGVCVDTPLRLTFDRPPVLGGSGVIEIHRADGTVADSIDLADPASFERTVGDAVSDTGVPHAFAY